MNREAETIGVDHAIERSFGATEERHRVLVGSLFASPLSIVISNTIGILVVYFTWTITGRRHFAVLAALGLTVLLGRMVTLLRYHRADHSADTVARNRRWNLEFQAGATLFALVQGLCCFASLAYADDFAAQLVNVIAVTAFSSGYVARNAGTPGFVFLQLLVMCVPMMLGLLWSDHVYYDGIALFIVLYMMTNLVITQSLNKNIRALAEATLKARSNAAAAKKNADQAAIALHAMTHGLALYDRALQLELENDRHLEMFGIGTGTSGPGLDDLLSAASANGNLSAPDAQKIGLLVAKTMRTRCATSFETANPDGRTFALHIEPTEDGGVLLLTEDATADKQVLDQIETLARKDGLTGLANRYELDRRLEGMAGDLADGTSVAVLYMDVDNFKDINDSLGHSIGDIVLIAVASRIRSVIRASDLVARFGGDEFVVVMEGVAPDDALESASRILAALDEPIDAAGHELTVCASFGIATGPQHGLDGTQLLSAADLALYEAKSAGRGKVAVYNSTMAAGFRRRMELSTEMRAALASDQFKLHYQPIIEIESGHIVSVEALIRWNHPDKGSVPPAEFIPLAERSGFISEIGDWVIRRACRDLVLLPADISVAVNVSSVQFHDPDRLVRVVEEALRDAGADGNRLEMELTETVLVEDRDKTRRTMQRLRNLGLRFGLDDFGTGYSSIGYLASYPFDKVKIDRSFAENIDSDMACRSVMEMVQHLANRLGFVVVAEGIESPYQLTAINEIGIVQGQGFLFGRALPVEELRARIAPGPHLAAVSDVVNG
ncbi:putative bifunctional diguanylate cyclase/phosphodiesterase [Consotaella aegiceratis]|uniref:putative bifunctional diguanylate cyclase/phosphodiesterase n=1 Tax=Consotaella aegiceratis TaxID=3097961 RepID=UPI002F411F3A